MKAIVYYDHGSPDVLKYEDIEKPIPADDEVLLKVRAASLNPADSHMMHGVPAVFRLIFRVGTQKMNHPGFDVAGEVEAVGKSVTQFRPGDQVFGSCKGAFAEYACAPEAKLVNKPESVTFEQAAAAPVATYTALHGFRKGNLQAGQKVLVHGAAGGVGTFIVQIAKSFGAEVTGVCSTSNLDMVRSIGADRVIDYTRENFTALPDRYDIIFDLVGNHSLLACRRVLNRQGTYLGAGVLGAAKSAFVGSFLMGSLLSRLGSQRFVIFIARANQEDLAAIRDLMAAGKVKPVIDRCYSLRETPEAMRHLETKRARGKIIITVT